MGARMNDTIHIQVKVVKFHAIWIRFGCINRNLHSVDFASRLKRKKSDCVQELHGIQAYLVLETVDNNRWIFSGEPSEECRDSHDAGESTFFFLVFVYKRDVIPRWRVLSTNPKFCFVMGLLFLSTATAVGGASLVALNKLNKVVKSIFVPSQTILVQYCEERRREGSHYYDGYKVNLPPRFVLLKNSGSKG